MSFKITVAEGREFHLNSYQVCEVPKQVSVWENATLGAMGSYSTPELTISKDIGVVVFYMPENIATGKEGCNTQLQNNENSHMLISLLRMCC